MFTDPELSWPHEISARGCASIEFADYWTDNIGDNLDGQLLANMKDFSAQM
jgi:hypothetical protein